MKTITAHEANNLDEQKSSIKRRVRKSDFQHHLFIESYGVKLSITSNTADGIEDARKIIAENFPDCFREMQETEVEYRFLLVRNHSAKDSLFKNGEKVLTRINRKQLLNTLISQVRLTVAEFAVGHVFIHAGAVSWKGKAIMIPGSSFSGKTTLTTALIKRGATYYSDEYAVLDEEGYVHPFTKPLSIRGEIDDYTQVEHSVESLGGTAATEKTNVSMVLITEYKPNAKWNPKVISNAQGILGILKHSVSIRQNPVFTLRVLNRVATNALIVKSKRGDVSEQADLILNFCESACS